MEPLRRKTENENIAKSKEMTEREKTRMYKEGEEDEANKREKKN